MNTITAEQARRLIPPLKEPTLEMVFNSIKEQAKEGYCTCLIPLERDKTVDFWNDIVETIKEKGFLVETSQDTGCIYLSIKW